MATSYTTGYDIKLIGTGLEAGTWGTSTNENLGRVENALGGSVAINVESPPSGSSWNSGTKTLTWLLEEDAASGTAGSTAVGGGRARVVVFGDAGSDLAAAVTVLIRGKNSSSYPERMFFVKNALSGGENLQLDLNGTDYVVRNGRYAAIFTSSTAKGTGTKIAASSVNNALAYPQISNLDFQDDTTAQIVVADSQTSALTITDGTSSLAVFDSTNNQAVFAKVDINSGTVDSCTIGDSASSGSNTVLHGASAGTAFGASSDQNTSVGSLSMSNCGSSNATVDNVAFGYRAGINADASNRNSFIGTQSGEDATYMQDSVLIGYKSGINVESTSGSQSYRNVAVGALSLSRNSIAGAGGASDNTAIGYGAISMEATGLSASSTAVGSYALGRASVSLANVAIGYKSMYDGSTNPTGAYNVGVGNESLRVIAGGDKNVCIGTSSGDSIVSGDGNVMIGHESGKDETGSDKLYIENSDSAAPLIYGEFDNDKVQINSAHTSNNTLTVNNSHSSYTGDLLHLTTTDAADSGFDFIKADANTANQFRVNGAGTVYAQNTTVQAADYADMFEWEDGNPDGEDRVGVTVLISNSGKIKPSSEGDIPEDIFGVVTGTACVVGNTAWNHWDRKYLKDDHGRVVQRTVNGKPNPVLNPDYDDDIKYIPRIQRPEWSPIGLVGRIHINKGQPVNPAWRLLRDVSENTEEWLVR